MRILATITVVLALCGCGQTTFPAIQRSANNGIAALGTATEAVGKPAKRLFISDAGTGEVYLYDVPSLKLFTILQGFARPQGECADDKGDVWVTDGSAAEIYELSYSGAVKATLSDTTGYPDGCVWNPKNGNLAVMNYVGLQSKSGSVLVYHDASGEPNTYTNPKQYYYNFAGYDSSGNLYFDGGNAQGNFMLSELPVNGSSAHTIAVSGGKIYTPGMVQWDGTSKYLDVGDQNCGHATTSCLYQLSLSAKQAAVKNKVDLKTYKGTPVCDLVQGVVDSGELFGSDNDYCGNAPSATYGWHYPAGGAPKSYNNKNASMPLGAAIGVNAKSPQQKSPWMDLNAKNLDLLYIADGNGEVTVYTYWQKTLVGELTGFGKPEGMCVDSKNNVYITDAGKDSIVEYAHAGRKPLRTIKESPYVPYGCAVDFTTGNLAVANDTGGSSGEGNIAIYKGAAGKPTIYTDSTIGNFSECVYDNKGNLLVSNGELPDEGDSYFAWLPRAGARLEDISIPGPYKSWTWRFVQGLQWDGRYFVIDYYDLYRYAIQNGEAYYIGYTNIGETSVDGPYWIYNKNPKKQGTGFVGASYNRSYPEVEYFNYPAGGDATGYVTKGIDDPVNVTISLGKIHE